MILTKVIPKPSSTFPLKNARIKEKEKNFLFYI